MSHLTYKGMVHKNTFYCLVIIRGKSPVNEVSKLVRIPFFHFKETTPPSFENDLKIAIKQWLVVQADHIYIAVNLPSGIVSKINQYANPKITRSWIYNLHDIIGDNEHSLTAVTFTIELVGSIIQPKIRTLLGVELPKKQTNRGESDKQ